MFGLEGRMVGVCSILAWGCPCSLPVPKPGLASVDNVLAEQVMSTSTTSAMIKRVHQFGLPSLQGNLKSSRDVNYVG